MVGIAHQILFLLKLSWETSKRYCFITAANSLFNAFLPLVNIIGLGAVVNALVINETFDNVLKIIIIYLSINLGIAVIKEILNLIELYIMRVASNIAQYAWSEDTVSIDYHYAQDGMIRDLRMKSMGAHPAFYMHNLGSFIKYFIQFLGIISILSLISPLFIFLITATSAFSIALIFKTRKNDFDFQNGKVEEDRKIDCLYKIMTEYGFAKEVRINSAKNYISKKYSDILLTQIAKLKTLYKKSIKINLLSEAISITQTIMMYFYFSYQAYNAQITIAEYTVLLSATTLLASLLLGFFDNVAQLGKTCERVCFNDEYRKLIENHSSVSSTNIFKEQDINFLNAVIKFENVSFTYPNTGKSVLKNINLEIRKGEKLGVVGLNGSGKTTLVKLLTRLYDPTEGRITIDGVDIKSIPYRQYAKHIGIVLQDFFLFAYSVKENVVLDTEYVEKDFLASIEKSGLKGKVDSLEKGTETSVYKALDADGVEFSGGEGQKLALARAIYKNGETVILDEPTSALDPVAEYELFMKLNDISENKAAIFISHRLSSTKFCNRIIVLYDGEIIESGNHYELIKLGGFYSELFNAQARYYKAVGVAVNE